MITISKKYFGFDLGKCTFLGAGCEGKVYLTPEGTVLKIFKNKKHCKEESRILKRVEGSKYFPKIIDCNEKCILREYIGGTPINEYLKNRRISKKLSISLIQLIEEFDRLKFKRRDTSFWHLYVQKDESLRIIDPRKSYKKNKPVPESILKGIEKLNMLDDFLKVLIELKPKWAQEWIAEM